MIRPFANVSVPTALKVLSALNSNEHICKLPKKISKGCFIENFVRNPENLRIAAPVSQLKSDSHPLIKFMLIASLKALQK